jgi:guanylate kinase
MGTKREGHLIVISAPSGAGKSTLCRRLLKRRRSLVLSTSVTTRLPRPGEKDGRDYFFVSEAAFRAMRARRQLVESAEVHGHSYGTPRTFLEDKLKSGYDVLLEIDVQGALQVKRRYPEAVLIFVRTPRFADLERRLRHRSSESEPEIRRRLADARRELKFLNQYHYEVVNDHVPTALGKLEAIIDAESARVGKSHDVIRQTSGG